jgi:hypothetical protein
MNFNKIWSFLSNLPSIVYVFLIPLGIIALIGGIITLFFALATVEGVASAVLLIAGFVAVRAGSSIKFETKKQPAAKQMGTGWARAMGICFFALMGLAIDQPGNIIYNKPIELLYCPAQTQLVRGSQVSHPLPGRTDINQEFTCVDPSGTATGEIDMFSVILVRFVEYVFIGYGLIGVSTLLDVLSARGKRDTSGPLNSSESGLIKKQ